MNFDNHVRFMRRAVELAIVAKEYGDYPIGAVVVNQIGELLAEAGNSSKINNDPTQHAEMCSIISACQKIGKNDLYGCTLYSTHEPCPMCATAAIFSHISTVVWGCSIDDMMSYWKTIDIHIDELAKKSTCNSNLVCIPNFLRDECLKLMQSQVKKYFIQIKESL